MDFLINNQLLSICNEEMPLEKVKHKLWRTIEKYFDQFDKNIQKIILRIEIILIKLTDINRVEQFFQTVLRNAPI